MKIGSVLTGKGEKQMTYLELEEDLPKGCKDCRFKCVKHGNWWCAANRTRIMEDYLEERPYWCLLKSQGEVKTYGKLYKVSPKVATEYKTSLEKKLYEDICKCLIKNGVLTLHSEVIANEITYGWELKGVTIDDNPERFPF